jgi:hypothetical protein
MATLTKEPVPIVGTGVPPIRLGVYGEGGAGKTSLLLSFPRPLVIDTDGGLEGDAVIGVDGDEWSPDKWQDLNALYTVIKERVTKKPDLYKTIGIDSIDTLARFLLHEAENIPTQGRKANASETEMITAEQRDYGKVATAIDIFLTKLKVLSRERGIHVVLTSAVRLPDVDKGRTKRTFDVQPAVEANILYWCNIYGELEVVEVAKSKGSNEMIEQRILWTRVSDRARKNKTRFAALRPGITNPTFDKITKLIEKGA